MRVLNLIWKFSTGGIGKCFLTYATLSSADNNICVTSACIDPQNCNYDRNNLKQINARIISIKNKKDFSWIRKTKALIDEIKPDIIFCHGFNGPIIVQIIKWFYNIKIPMICSYHGLYHAPTPQKRFIAPIFNRTQIWLYKHYANRIILVENFSKKYLLKNGISIEKLFVCHNGIPDITTTINNITLPQEEIQICLASRLDSVKGIEYLLQAIPLVKAKTKNPFKVYILGDGPLEKKLIQISQKLNINDSIVFLGYQNNIPEWLATWDIFVLPSLFEYHSIALLEAMRAGKAIIATTVGGNEESVTNHVEALTIPSNDSIALSEALIKLIENPQLRKKIGENARKRFLIEFTENTMKKNLIKALTL